jgi:respiratory nitrate reductase gamma subunit
VTSLLFVALPYASVAVFIIGLIVRFRSGTTISSQSSQILESRWLVWGTVPFHIGIGILFLDHFIPLLFPDAWRQLVSNRGALLAVESSGAASALLCLFGLAILFVRRLAPSVRAGSRGADLFVLAILIAQVALGLGVATMHRWGSVWSVAIVVPYLRSLIAFQPDTAFAAALPRVIAFHFAGAWIVLALLPFTRLVHMLTFPLPFLWRVPQKVVWMGR